MKYQYVEGQHKKESSVRKGVLAVLAAEQKTGQQVFGPEELRKTAQVPPDLMWDVIGALPERIAGPTMENWRQHFEARTDRQSEEMDHVAPPPPKPTAPPVPLRIGQTDLRSLEAEHYVRALTGTDVRPGRRIRCPLPSHDDNHPSFSVKGRIWRCFGCGNGGDIFELASLLWGRAKNTKEQFHELACELEEKLG